jgi:hypothetical protein
MPVSGYSDDKFSIAEDIWLVHPYFLYAQIIVVTHTLMSLFLCSVSVLKIHWIWLLAEFPAPHQAFKSKNRGENYVTKMFTFLCKNAIWNYGKVQREYRLLDSHGLE